MNSVFHLVAGVSGSAFQTPFASPPGQGLSSSMVNVLWALFNLLVAYLIVERVGKFEIRQTKYFVPFALGVAMMAVPIGSHFRSPARWGCWEMMRTRGEDGKQE